MMTEQRKLVAEFQEKFETPTDPDFWKTLVDEEFKEVVEALADLSKELADLFYVLCGFVNVSPDEGEAKRYAENVCEELEHAVGLIEAPGVLEEAFRRVHASNMSKLGDDGKPVRREDGKVLKGPNYKPPHLTDLFTKE